MKRKKFLKISSCLFFATALVILLINAYHPILIKWIAGSGRIVGKPLKSEVYINGRLDSDVRLFKMNKYWNDEKADIIIVYAPNSKNNFMSIYLIDILDEDIKLPISTLQKDYDVIDGILFQSETGASVINLNTPEKSFDDFRINMKIESNQISFYIPHSFDIDNVKSDLVRIKLNPS
jgi:hypothetical protein